MTKSQNTDDRKPVRARTLTLATDYVVRHPRRYLFPIKPGAKFPPLIRDNLAKASNDPAQLEAWENQWPGCNWGVALAKSGLLVADVDVNAAKGKIGQTTFDNLDLDYGWPETETTTTPSGGFHKIYEGWATDDHPAHIMALGENGFGKDIDCPNYLIIPGCTLDGGGEYVTNGVEAVAAPEWAYDVIRTSKTKNRVTDAGEIVVELDQQQNIDLAIDFLQNDAEEAIEGQGGDIATLRAAMYLKDLGISQQLGAELLNEHFNPRCSPPWDLEDLARKMASAYASGSLSKVGGKTAEADFGDDPVEPVAPEMKAAARGKRLPWDDQCAIIVKPPAFVDIRDRTMLNNKSFNNRFGRIGGDDAHRRAIASKHIARYHGVGFKPVDVRSFKVNGKLLFNLFQPHKIEELDGKPSIIIEHLGYLIPDAASRKHFVNWLAWMVQCPDKKLMHAALLLGRKGTGKSVIGELMKVILGAHNCSEPSRKRVASEFNGWLANKLLIIIHELKEKGARGLYDELKEYVTQTTTSINLKGIEAHELDNFAAFLTITNDDDALPIDDNERRYLVIRCADDPCFGKGTPESAAYYKRLFDCIGTSDKPGDEARRFLRALRARDLTGYNGQGPAPETEAKAEMVEAGQNSVQRFIREKIEANEWPLGANVISPADVFNELPFGVEKHLHNERTVEAALREVGCRPLKDLGPLRTRSGRKRLWARDGSTVKAVCATLGRAGVIAAYDAAVAGRSAVNAAADAAEAMGEFNADAATA